MSQSKDAIIIGIIVIVVIGIGWFAFGNRTTITPISSITDTQTSVKVYSEDKDVSFEAVVVDHEELGEVVERPIQTDVDEEPSYVAKTLVQFNEFGNLKQFELNKAFLQEDFTRAESNLSNPTYAQVMSFIKQDKTDEILPSKQKSEVYVDSPWRCADFANTFRRNANDAGYRCAVVAMDLATVADPMNVTTTHAIVAFETSDKGLVYIEPQDDEIVATLRQGQVFPEPPLDEKIPDTWTVVRRAYLLW